MLSSSLVQITLVPQAPSLTSLTKVQQSVTLRTETPSRSSQPARSAVIQKVGALRSQHCEEDGTMHHLQHLELRALSRRGEEDARAIKNKRCVFVATGHARRSVQESVSVTYTSIYIHLY